MVAFLPPTMPDHAPERQELSQEVVDGVRRGDSDAVVTAYRVLSGPVYGYLLNQSRDPVWAQDLTADVFLEVMEGASRFQGPPSGFRAWVFRIARNSFIDHVRKESRRRHESVEAAEEAGRLPESSADPERDALSHVETERILEVMEDLSPDQREVLLLRLVADLPIAEVAEIVGKTPGAVKALQHRALRSLENRLEAGGGGA